MVEAHEGLRTGPIVHISRANRANAYFCIGHCGDQVIPVQGPHMPWHYRHREDSTCPYLQAHRGEGWGPPTTTPPPPT
jgi:hypothetical protein